MKRFLTILAVAVAAAVALPSTSSAQAKFGAGIDFRTDGNDVGIEARVDIPMDRNISIVPNFAYFFTDIGTFFTLDGNLQYLFAGFRTGGGAYVLGGLDIGVFSYSGSSTTKLGLNLGGGVRGPVGTLELYGEAKVVLGDFDTFNIGGGLYF